MSKLDTGKEYPMNGKLAGLDAGLYLRKSRMEEGLDTDEVLARHQKALLD